MKRFEASPRQHLILLNPHAQGGRVERYLPVISQWLKLHRANCKLCTNGDSVTLAAPKHLDESLKRIEGMPNGSRVVAVGGDGSINRWLPSLLEKQHSLGIVPLGSGNDGARALGLYGAALEESLQLALHGQAFPVDTGVVKWTDTQGLTREAVFLDVCTCGFDSSIALRALQGPLWLRGMPRYLWATVRELIRLRAWRVRVEVDAQPLLSQKPKWTQALFVSSFNTPSFGAGIPAAPQASVTDGKLNLLFAAKLNRLQALILLPRLLFGRHLGHSKIHTTAYQQLHLESPEGIPLAVDGEYLGMATQVLVSCAHKSLWASFGRDSFN
jgi:diacylglycerol kinase (ATP)